MAMSTEGPAWPPLTKSSEQEEYAGWGLGLGRQGPYPERLDDIVSFPATKTWSSGKRGQAFSCFKSSPGVLPESWRRGKGGRKYPRDYSSMYPSIYCVLRTEKTAESKAARDSLLPGFRTWTIGLRGKVTCFFFP